MMHCSGFFNSKLHAFQVVTISFIISMILPDIPPDIEHHPISTDGVDKKNVCCCKHLLILI